MIKTNLAAHWRRIPTKFEAAALALAVLLTLPAGTAQTAEAEPEIVCPASNSAGTDTSRPSCDSEDTATGDAAMVRSLEALSAHGLDPAAYVTGSKSARDAWLLAATHLRRGVLDSETYAPRMTPDLALAASLDALPAKSDAAAYRAALEAFAPSSHLYSALQTELQRQQYARATSKDPQTTSAAELKIAKLLVSLEHLRWLSPESSPRQIYANIPSFEVIAFAGEKEFSRHVAIYGELDRQTPEFSDSITYLEFSPWWNVPSSIARDEKLTQFQRDPGEIERLGYQVLDSAGKRVDATGIDWDTLSPSTFPYRIRQGPGPANALGRVKFMFPNSHSIYLHDTPESDLFSQEQRTLSAGCIRVQGAVELSEWVLEETPSWGRTRIDRSIASNTATRARLSTPISIHIVYLTAFPAADGSVVYTPDVYGLDAEMLPALASYTLEAEARAVPSGSAE